MLQIAPDSTIKSLFSKTCYDISHTVKQILWPPKIRNFDNYVEFLHDNATRSAGGLVLSYAQKRAGKLHFRLAKEQDYADVLVQAQIGLHAEIVSDLWFLTLEFLDTPPKLVDKLGHRLLEDLHQRYVQTAPDSPARKNGFANALQRRHLSPKHQGIRAFSEKSGNILFELLPLTEDLLEENREVFIGQLRARYIGFFEKLDSRLDRDAFLSEFEKLR